MPNEPITPQLPCPPRPTARSEADWWAMSEEQRASELYRFEIWWRSGYSGAAAISPSSEPIIEHARPKPPINFGFSADGK